MGVVITTTTVMMRVMIRWARVMVRTRIVVVVVGSDNCDYGDNNVDDHYKFR